MPHVARKSATTLVLHWTRSTRDFSRGNVVVVSIASPRGSRNVEKHASASNAPRATALHFEGKH